MKDSRIKLFRGMFMILIIISIFMVPGTSAFANVRVEGGNVPYYARLSSEEIYHDGDIVAIIFYRPTTCIPAGFNLLDFFDIPGAFDCNPPTTQGFEIWENEPGVSAPLLAETQGLGAVPIWFVSLNLLNSAISDGVLTIGELSSLHPLIGYAIFYHETLRPTGSVKLSTGEINASGELSDGRSFQLQIVAVDYPVYNVSTHINFK